MSGEFLLKTGRPNGGTIILARAAWVSTIMFALTLLLRSGSYASWSWSFWTWGFDSTRLREEIAANVPWFGAIFAGAYAALYARFSAQFSYLAGVYNQLMEIQVAGNTESNPAMLAMWMAGFIEDALSMHLATKPMFAVAIWGMLERTDIYDQFVENTLDGKQKVEVLVRSLKRAIGEDNLRNSGGSRALLAGRRPTDPCSPLVPSGPDTSRSGTPMRRDATALLVFAGFVIGWLARK